MKKIAISKTGKIVLAVGMIVVILGGLGFTRYQQSAEQALVEEDVAASELRLTQFNNPVLQEKLHQLELQVEERQRQTDDLFETFKESVISADVTEQFFQTAHGTTVHIDLYTSVPIARETIAGISVLKTSVNARVTGTLSETIAFVENLNDYFMTGYVTNVRFLVVEPSISGSLGLDTTLQLDFIVYTRDEGVQ